MLLVRSLGFQKPKLTQSKPTFRPSLLGRPHGYIAPKKPLARALEQGVLAADRSFGFSPVWPP